MTEVRTFLSATASRVLPRMLTQISRDPAAPFYGACDRNWWHYKVRDFPSIILQQAGYALAMASDLPVGADNSAQLRELAAATARFWNQRAVLHGAFEEYYPYEQGYPPAAFSSLTTAKLCHLGIVPLADIRPGLAIAARQLLTRFEAQAANQQLAGTAALAVIRALDASLVDEPAFQQNLNAVLALQHDEGWFPEYDGPDLGYLTVSIDCLWDLFDHTRDPRVRQAIVRAAGFAAWFVLSPLAGVGMHNSRNTDYFVPYGLVRLAIENQCPQTMAVIRKLFSRSGTSGFHPFDAVDDRYWCHYIGHSVMRALRLLEAAPSIAPPAAPTPTPVPSQQAGSGHALLGSASGATAMVATRKGAITTACWPDGATAADFGWVVHTPNQVFVSHWWSPDWTVTASDTTAGCAGYLVAHKEQVSAPWKHIVLRLASYVCGRHLIRLLKRLVIFKRPQQTLHFTRRISWLGETLEIHDTLTGLAANMTVTRAPRSSKRHVASADSFHAEDFSLLRGIDRCEEIRRSPGAFECVTRYQLAIGS